MDVKSQVSIQVGKPPTECPDQPCPFRSVWKKVDLDPKKAPVGSTYNGCLLDGVPVAMLLLEGDVSAVEVVTGAWQ